MQHSFRCPHLHEHCNLSLWSCQIKLHSYTSSNEPEDTDTSTPTGNYTSSNEEEDTETSTSTGSYTSSNEGGDTDNFSNPERLYEWPSTPTGSYTSSDEGDTDTSTPTGSFTSSDEGDTHTSSPTGTIFCQGFPLQSLTFFKNLI